MKGVIAGIDWLNAEPMKYWSFPASYPKDKKKNEVESLIKNGEYLGALKVDGYYQRLVKDEDGNVFMVARNKNVKGDITNKIEWLPHLNPWLSSLPCGTCFLCECYLPHNEGSKNTTTILGCLKDEAIKRQADIGKLHLYIFDVMAYQNCNFIDTAYVDRVNTLKHISNTHKYNYVEFAEFYEGETLWSKLQEYLSSGREGIVVMRKDAKVYFKRTPARVSIKVKKEIKETIDCIVYGANPPEVYYTGTHLEDWEYFCDKDLNKLPKGKHYGEKDVIPVTRSFYKNLAGSLKLALYDNGELLYFGDLSGLPDEVLLNWEKYIGRVCEVGGMEVDAKSGHIRHPIFVQWREDKLPNECSAKQIKA